MKPIIIPVFTMFLVQLTMNGVRSYGVGAHCGQRSDVRDK
jgi:hypothetical protein